MTRLADERTTAIDDKPATEPMGHDPAQEPISDNEVSEEPTLDDEPAAEPTGERDGLEVDEGTSAEGAWLELAVDADVEAVEAVSEILSRFAPGGTSVEPAYELVDEGLAARIDSARPAVVRVYLPARDRSAARRAVAAAREALGHLQAFGLRPIGDLETRVVHEADWAEAWKAHFPVLRIGRRLVIRPTWRRHRRQPSDIVLALDPGMAFGTGLHPTTRLCLEGVERWADKGLLADGGAANDGRAGTPPGREPTAAARVLDVGCGSGILSIAALKLGAADVLAIDTDPIAIEATQANARRHGIARRLVARQGTLPTRSGGFDLVLANLVASLLVDLAPLLHDELRPNGRLLASGIFVDREDAVRAAFGSVGLRIVGRWADGDWVAIEAERVADR